MHRIDTLGHDNNLFKEYSPEDGPGTRVSPEWLNDQQENVCAVVEAAGLSLSKGDYSQLVAAIRILAGTGAGAVKKLTNADSPYTVQPEDGVILADCTDGQVEILLISAAAGNARRLKVKKTDESANEARLTPQAGEKTNGVADQSLDLIAYGQTEDVVPDGTDDWQTL